MGTGEWALQKKENIIQRYMSCIWETKDFGECEMQAALKCKDKRGVMRDETEFLTVWPSKRNEREKIVIARRDQVKLGRINCGNKG